MRWNRGSFTRVQIKSRRATRLVARQGKGVVDALNTNLHTLVIPTEQSEWRNPWVCGKNKDSSVSVLRTFARNDK